MDHISNRHPPQARPTILVRLTGSYTASAAGLVVDYEKRRRGSPICALARKLIESGHDPAAVLLVYRGQRLCFVPRPLSLWASLTVAEGDNSRQSAHFVKFAPGPEKRPASIRSRGFTGVPGSARYHPPEKGGRRCDGGPGSRPEAEAELEARPDHAMHYKRESGHARGEARPPRPLLNTRDNTRGKYTNRAGNQS